MKFFLVISIIALWWVPVNSPGNVGIFNVQMSSELLPPKIEILSSSNKTTGMATKRKMDHFGFQFRKLLIKKNNVRWR